MKIYVCNYLQARQFVPDEPTLAIRIFDPGQVDPARNIDVPLQPTKHWVGELKYWFHDHDPVKAEIEGRFAEAYAMKNDPHCPTLAIADSMRKEFVEPAKKASAIMVHCMAGINRSTATARGLCEHYGLPIEWMENEFRKPMLDMRWLGNMYLYRMILLGRDDYAL